jgi:TonB-linked SusC/RagA family outer membrane protein
MMKIYKKCGLPLVILLMLVTSQSFAQTLAVSGKITDDSGTPVPGANILEKGTNNGTVSDANGGYSLNVSSGTATLVISFIGFKSQELRVDNRATVDVSLVPDATALTEVIVTGYASERKADLVSAISQVSAANTIAIPQSDIGQALQGRVAGVQVTTSGQPGEQSQVRIRGFGSFTNNSPLYVIDGVPTYDNSNINPYDIDGYTVLKDAGAASIYGARAAAGVILITTKHGKYDGSTKVSLDVNTGVVMQGNGVKNLNPQNQANAVYTALTNSGGVAANQPYGSNLSNPTLPDYINVGVPGVGAVGNVFSGDPRIATALANYNIDPTKGQIIQVVQANKGGTDWYKAMTRVAPVARYSLGLSGGSDKAHYYTNMTYQDQTGIAIASYMQRFNIRMNSEFKPMKGVRIGENALLTYRQQNIITNPQAESALNLAYRMPTIIPVNDVNGGWAGTGAPGFNNPANPVAQLTRQSSKGYDHNNYSQIFGNVYLEVDPIQHLTLRTSFGGSLDNYNALLLTPRTYENAENTSSTTLVEAMSTNLNYTWTNLATYQNKFGNHSLRVLAGTEAIKTGMGRNIFGFGLNPFSLDPNYISLSNTNSTGRQLASSPSQTATLASFFGKVDYNYQDKYYLSATIRRDGSSVFGPQNRYGVFPAVSGAWRLSTESFMAGVNWVNDLKLRGGYGIMGNQFINPTNQYTLFQGGPGNSYDISGTNNSVTPGVIPLQVGNPAGKWEQNKTANIGLDGTFFNSTTEIILEFWQKKTDGLLVQPQFLQTAGVYPNNPFVNIGQMTNQGIDLQIIRRIKVNNDWSMVVDANISPFKNTINSISTGQNYFTSGTFRNLTFIRNQVGQPLSSFYGYQVTGYFNSAADVSGSATQDQAAPGRFKYKDTDGDGKITPNDRVFMGSPIPKFTYGINLNVKYRNWSLDAFLYGVYGNKIVNFSKWYNNFYQSFSGAALSQNVLQAWTPALGNSAKTPILETASNFSTNSTPNSWYVEPGSYARLKNLQLGYTLPTAMLSKYGIQRMKVYVQAINLFTITKYSGQDPEIVGNVDTTRGIDIGNFPATRQYMFGINVGF